MTIRGNLQRGKGRRRLYICPRCDYHGTVHTNSNRIWCERCGAEVDLRKHAMFSRKRLAEARTRREQKG